MLRKSEANRYDYDFQNDTIFFYKTGDNYVFSIDLDGIILDVNEDSYIIGIEILDASKKFKISKTGLRDIHEFNSTIKIDKKSIELNMELKVVKRNKLINRFLDALTSNTMNLPSRTQGLALTC